MAELPTNYLDDILAASMGGKRIFKITHSDGTTEEVTIEDVSEYEQVGSNFGAGDINNTNAEVNKKFDSGDVVDPMETTEPGFAADAYQTKLQFDEQNKNIQEVFQLGTNRKAQIISSLSKSGLGLTSDSTWDTIASKLAAAFPGYFTKSFSSTANYSGSEQSQQAFCPITLDAAKKATSLTYTFSAFNESGAASTTHFYFQGSTDNSSWVELYHASMTCDNEKTFTFANNLTVPLNGAAYKYYRIVITARRNLTSLKLSGTVEFQS